MLSIGLVRDIVLFASVAISSSCDSALSRLVPAYAGIFLSLHRIR
jgi:hypothetical protein